MSRKKTLVVLAIAVVVLLLGLSRGFHQTNCQHINGLTMKCSDGNNTWTQPTP